MKYITDFFKNLFFSLYCLLTVILSVVAYYWLGNIYQNSIVSWIGVAFILAVSTAIYILINLKKDRF